MKLQVPERDTNAQRSEVPLAEAPTSRRKGGKRKRTDSETARDQLGRKLPQDKGREGVGPRPKQNGPSYLPCYHGNV